LSGYGSEGWLLLPILVGLMSLGLRTLIHTRRYVAVLLGGLVFPLPLSIITICLVKNLPIYLIYNPKHFSFVLPFYLLLVSRGLRQINMQFHRGITHRVGVLHQISLAGTLLLVITVLSAIALTSVYQIDIPLYCAEECIFLNR